MRIAITGGVGCGVSEVCRQLKARDIRVISADEIGHQVLEIQPVRQKVVERFGWQILGENEKIDRLQLGQVVFSDEEARKDLNSIVHPTLLDILSQEIRHIESESGIVVVDAALIFEWGLQGFFHKVIVVEAPLQMRIQRLMQRDQLTEEQVYQRINTQLSVEKKAAQADVVISNDGTLEELHLKVDEVWEEITGV